jgi:hypothetical protein
VLALEDHLGLPQAPPADAVAPEQTATG